MDESEYQLGMARLMRITNRMKDSAVSSQSPEVVGNYHICKICGHSWKVRAASPEPKSCPKCRSTMWNSPMARNVVCARCGYRWNTNRERPSMCPRCKSRTYDSLMLQIKCRTCGAVWESRMDWQSEKVLCPNCGSKPKKDVFVVRQKENEKREVTEEQIEDLKNQTDDYSKYVYLRKIGATTVETDILMRYFNHDKPVKIAMDLDIPLGLVFETIAPYVDAEVGGQ